MRLLHVLDQSGDTEIKWDPNDGKSTAEAREIVADLKAKGYVFYLTDKRLADEVTAAADQGVLLVRRISAEELIDQPIPDASVIPEDSESFAAEPQPAPAKRGRPKKNAELAPPTTTAVATRPQRGG